MVVLEDSRRIQPGNSLHQQVVYAEYHSPVGIIKARNLTTTQKIVDTKGQHQPLSNSRLPKEITDSKLNYDGRTPSHDHGKADQQRVSDRVEGERSDLEDAGQKESDAVLVNKSSTVTDGIESKRTTLTAPGDFIAKANAGTPSMNGPDSLQLLRQEYLRYNTEQRVLNAEKFPPLAADGLVLVVQVRRYECTSR